MWSDEQDARLRAEAMAWLAVRTNDGEHPLTRDELRQDFVFDGVAVPLVDYSQGIWKPRGLRASLSILTTWTAPGKRRPYDDDTGPDGLLRYKWRGTDGDHWVNRGLRQAMHDRVPVIWFWAVGPGEYLPIFPIYLIDEEPALHQFVVATDGLQHLRPSLRTADSPAEEVMRSYIRREVDARVHQKAFRGMVMRAYGEQCAVCSLRHPRLLDAAHIVEDKHERGIAAVRNGLSLCKIHHAAYDTGVMGIDPDLAVHVRDDILAEVDGPMLEHGIKALHGGRLRVVPRRCDERPDRDLLDEHYRRFLAQKAG